MTPLRKNITLILLLLGVTCAFAQYGNEWIEYNITYYKFNVTREGIHRIPYSTLSALPNVNINTVQTTKFNLFSKGQTVPIYVYDSNNNGFFDNANDFIEFYGKPNDGSVDARLYADPERQQPNPYMSLFNDTAVYFLAWNTQKANILFSNIPNDLSLPLPAKEQYFMHTVRPNLRCTDPECFQLGRYASVGGQPIYECIFDEGEGFTYTPVEPSITIVAPLIYTNAPVNAHINANIVSLSSVNHFTLKINTYQLKDTFTTNVWLYKFSGDFPVSHLINYNDFTWTPSARSSAIAMVELIYPHEFTFPNESRSYFVLNQNGTGARYIEINAFNDRGTAPILYDLTNHLRITGTAGSSPHKFKLPAQTNNVKREIFVTSQDASDIRTITSVERVNFVNYYNTLFQGDYIILTHPKLRDDGNQYDYVDAYRKYRNSLEGGSHEVEIVLINQLYDQFAYGIKKSPLAIRNFIDFALQYWTIKPRHLFIIGKGREYNHIRFNASAYAQCLVPTFGNPGSDPLLTATTASIIPRVAVGRLSVENPVEIGIYLEKIKSYERKQREAGDPYQTIDNKMWMKRVLHMGGGEGAGQQAQFRYYLEKYENTIEDTLYGGHVYSFYKTSTDPIQNVQSDFLRELINTGVSLITFFGHSSPNSFDIAIDDPSTYTNYEKYHLILSNGCFTGNIFNPSKGISENFVLADGKAAIGFISTITLSSSTALDIYTTNFYKNLGQKYYGSTIGTIMTKSVGDVEACCPTAINKTVAEEMTLHGDPAIRLNPHSKPDYVIEPQMVSIEPSTISIEADSFNLKVIVTNLGYATHDSINVIVTRFFPSADDGSVTYMKRIRGTFFSDTLFFTIPTGSTKAFGLNRFCVKVDPGNNDACTELGVGEISELSETNNELGELTLNITSEDIFPIHPYEFAIVPAQPVTLKASTANVFAPVATYRIEIDTTESFNSPLKLSTTVTQSGGVVTWTPAMNYIDSTVYYWRVGVEGNSTFHNSSFIYLDGEYPGWNQSHYYQFLKDQYSNIYPDTDRKFKFVGDTKTVTVKTGTATMNGGALPDDQIAYHVNNGLKHRWNCGGPGGFDGGIVLAVFDSATGNNWVSRYSDVGTDPCSGYQINMIHGNIHCKARDLEGFDFPILGSNPPNTLCLQQRIVDFINNVPDGNYILAYSVNTASYSSWNQALVDAFRNLGSQEINSLICCNNIPWAFFVKKGHPDEVLFEEKGSGILSVLNFTATFQAFWYQGKITTPLIGPATEWGSLHWRYHALEPQSSDRQSIDIIGVTHTGAESVIDSNITALDYFISHIDPAEYPYIKLRLDTRDDSARTPTQLDFWRILYKKVPEAALNPDFHFEFHGDTVMLGENLTLSVNCENVTDIHMDSLLVKYTLLSSGNSPVN
ncbi:MAG TPA: C25 family cysteine peptidase, partial [Chitinophagales bacterium]|nr:C25 family cysteine peptidase [Chitinophagales bacterium]